MMARKRSARSRRRSKRGASPVVSEAERRLLDLARALPADGAGAVRAVADAYRPEGPLPRALTDAWTTARRDKTRALALAWAREQVRLSLEQALRGVATFTEPATLAWLMLAGCEALAHEPPAGAPDRLTALLELVRGTAAR